MILNSFGFLVFLYLILNRIECKRYGGGRGGKTSISRSRPSSPVYHPPAPRPPAYHPPAYHPPAYHPAAYHPSPSYPSTSHGASSQSSGGAKPFGFNLPKSSDGAGSPKRVTPVGHNPSREAGSRPIGFVDPHHPSAPVGPPKQNHAQASAPPHDARVDGAGRPVGFVSHVPPHSVSGNSGKSVETPKHSNPLGNGPPPYNPVNYGHNPPAYNPHYNYGGYGTPPAYAPMGHPTPSNPAGYGPPPVYTSGNYHGGYPASGGHHPYHQNQGSGGGITVINNNVNNHHHSSYGGYGSYTGWSYSQPVYTSHDTGSTALGFFLGYSLAKVTTPSYHYHNIYYDGNGYTPRFDHYTVHHYYHNNENVPKEATIQPNTIVGCVGDSGSFCPANTTSLCTSNGAVMCVASATSTVPCANEKQTNCVRSTVPCQNNGSPECQHSSHDVTSISIPCISTAKIYGNLSYQNNSIVVSNNTSSQSVPGNGTANNSGVISIAGSGGTGNVTVVDANVNATVTNSSMAANATSTEKAPSQLFCVTILALPAERKVSEGEKLFANTKNIFSQFAVKALGID